MENAKREEGERKKKEKQKKRRRNHISLAVQPTECAEFGPWPGKGEEEVPLAVGKDAAE